MPVSSQYHPYLVLLRAADGIRTRDLLLGKQVLNQAEFQPRGVRISSRRLM